MTEDVKQALKELGIEIKDDDDDKEEKDEASIKTFSIHGPDGFKYVTVTDGKTITIYNSYT